MQRGVVINPSNACARRDITFHTVHEYQFAPRFFIVVLFCYVLPTLPAIAGFRFESWRRVLNQKGTPKLRNTMLTKMLAKWRRTRHLLDPARQTEAVATVSDSIPQF
jgi:hypothetical protein